MFLVVIVMLLFYHFLDFSWDIITVNVAALLSVFAFSIFYIRDAVTLYLGGVNSISLIF